MMEKQNIEFCQLNYNVRTSLQDIFGKNKKKILKNVNGEFRGCELSAIVGPSGCGKSSLLNILSGFTTNFEGSIKVNGKPRELELFRKQSAYIMQEENLYKLLTLRETMNFSMNLKTGNVLTETQREKKIMSILENLGLDARFDTFVGDLSGGQQKRFSLAVELVDDPSIIFLDEPTTGLDSSSSVQCIQWLKQLAQEGRTIICTIHTPSARIFKMFDLIYALADGRVIYQGTSHNLIPFLKELDLPCPETFTPSDFLSEIAHDDYGPQNHRLTKKILNGMNKNYRLNTNREIILSSKLQDQITYENENNQQTVFSSSFLTQVCQLIKRNQLFNRRDTSFMLVRLTVHCFVGILVGLLYNGIGNDAKRIINIFKNVYVLNAFLMYSSLYSLTTRFPIDMPIIRREHFNRWYSIGAHYIALVISDLPILIACTLIFTGTVYIMTDHPIGDFRFPYLLSMAILMSFTSQAYGIFAGSIVELKLGLLFAALLLVYQIIFSGGLVFMKDVNPWWHWMFEISFMKHSLQGYTDVILGYNRENLECDDVYCHFATPAKFLKFIGLESNLPKVFYSMAFIGISLHFSAFLIMKIRLKFNL